MQFKFKKVSQKGLIAITAMLLTVLLGVQHVGQGQHQSTDKSDVLAMATGNSDNSNHGKNKADQATNAPQPISHASLANETLPIVHKSGTLVEDQSWKPGAVYIIDDPVYLPEGRTLTIGAGTVVKVKTSSPDGGIAVAGGQLRVEGVYNDPVTLTSYTDDSAGGDSNDGEAILPNNYSKAITYSAGVIHAEQVDIRNVNQAVSADCSNDIRNAIVIANSTIRSATSFTSCSAESLSITGTTFDVVHDYAITTQYAVPLGIVLTGSNRNTFNGTGKGHAIRVYGGTVPGGHVWNISGAGNAVIVLQQPVIVDGQVSISDKALVKGPASFIVNGSLFARGSDTNPVILQSIDDSNGDGFTPTGGSTSQGVIQLNRGGRVAISHALFTLVFMERSADQGTLTVDSTTTIKADATGASIDDDATALRLPGTGTAPRMVTTYK